MLGSTVLQYQSGYVQDITSPSLAVIEAHILQWSNSSKDPLSNMFTSFHHHFRIKKKQVHPQTMTTIVEAHTTCTTYNILSEIVNLQKIMFAPLISSFFSASCTLLKAQMFAKQWKIIIELNFDLATFLFTDLKSTVCITSCISCWTKTSFRASQVGRCRY